MFNGALGEVDTPQIGAGLGELLMIRSQPHPNLQDAQSTGFLEPGKIPDIGFEGIARLRLRRIARLFRIGKIEILATGGLVPKCADGLFCFVHAGVPMEG